MRFHTTILQSGGTATGIRVPDEVVEALGSGKRPAVTVTSALLTPSMPGATPDRRWVFWAVGGASARSRAMSWDASIVAKPKATPCSA